MRLISTTTTLFRDMRLSHNYRKPRSIFLLAHWTVRSCSSTTIMLYFTNLACCSYWPSEWQENKGRCQISYHILNSAVTLAVLCRMQLGLICSYTCHSRSWCSHSLQGLLVWLAKLVLISLHRSIYFIRCIANTWIKPVKSVSMCRLEF
jgi:hypothetical protein